MVIPALLLATGVALSSPVAGSHGSAVGTGYPVESGRPAVAAHEAHRPATHVDRGHAPSGWYVVVRPQHRRLRPAAVPAQPRVLRPGLLLHSASQRHGAWIRCYDPQGKSWVNVANVRPAQQPRGWDKLVLKIHPVLRPRVTLPPPLPVAQRAAVISAAAPVATPAVVAPQATAGPQVVQVVQVVQPAGSIPDQIVAAGDAAWGPGQGQALLWIAMRESGANPYAVNAQSGACGIGQRLPCSVPLGNAPVQIADMVSYVTQRYGNASTAQAFWMANSYY